MDEVKLKELMKKIYSNTEYNIEIESYLKWNYKYFAEIMKFIETNFWFKNDIIHLYLIFLESYIKTNQPLPDSVNKYIKYIFENLSEIAKENIFINNFLRKFYCDKLLFSNQILAIISSFEINKFDEVIKQRLINWFIANYNNWILLKNYKTFFRAILDDILKNSINLLSEYRINLRILLNYFWYSLSESIIIINILEQNWIENYYLMKTEAWIINNLWETVLIQELNKLDNINLIRFVNAMQNIIDFIAIKEFDDFRKEIKFYISIISSKQLFPQNQIKDFFDYYIKLISKENISLLKYINDIKSIDKILAFLSANNINFFEHEEFATILFKRIVEELSYSITVTKLINANKEYYTNNFKIILNAIKTSNIQPKSFNIIWDIILSILEAVLEKWDLKSFIDIIDSQIFLIFNNDQKYNIWRMLSFTYKYWNFNKLKYKEIEKIFIFALKDGNISDFQLQTFVESLSSLWQKCRYIIWRYIKQLENRIPKYALKSIKEKIFISRSFPFVFYHFIKYILE